MSHSFGLKGYPFSQPGLQALGIGVVSVWRAESPSIRERGVGWTTDEWSAHWALDLVGAWGQGLQPWLGERPTLRA